MGIPGQAVPREIKDQHLRRFLQRLYEAVQTLRGEAGIFDDKAVTVKMLRELGILGVQDADAGLTYNPNAVPEPGLVVSQPAQYFVFTDEAGEAFVAEDGSVITSEVG